ncbi:hypothetical protein [Alishewanella tabrizica]|uniref:Uncharacterized protein n=1 Tax=Alishewanella tabrizica TaxID=671278 RepID=A0ABQ2WVA2_9ALTE|nr:hypothetical protein [Alishewanella tabrizica]GGW72370.1 hypothetical protein GCM10008111_30600 [Alishewanella tabrizica]
MRVNLITSCVSAKNTTVGDTVALTDAFAKGCNSAEEWLNTLSGKADEMLSLLDLYKGDHWSIAKNLNTLKDVTLWVVSAGLGFAHHSKLARPYDATFNKSSPNFVGNIELNKLTIDPTKSWWSLLHKNQNAFKKLVKKYPEDMYIFCSSESYLVAIENDLLDLVHKGLFNESNFLIITSNSKINKNLNRFVLKSKEKFSSSEQIKGSMVSLNIRLARYLIQASINAPYPLKKMIEVYKELDHSLPDTIRKKINRLNDSDVMNEISKLPNSSLKSATSALRALRDKGISCEQKRFSRLFAKYHSSLEF